MGGRTPGLTTAAKYRTEHAPQATFEAAAVQAAIGSGATKSAKNRTEDTSKATRLPTGLARQVTCDQHGKDWQHLLEKCGVQATVLGSLSRHLTADVLRPENATKQRVAPSDRGGLAAYDVVGEPGPAERINMRFQCSGIVPHSA